MVKNMKREDIRSYFEKAKERCGQNTGEYEIPVEMRDGASWKFMESSLTEHDVQELEKELQITLPEDYKNYITTAAHMFCELEGNLDNFLFEDDVDIMFTIVPQPYKEELKYIKELLKGNEILLAAGYLPLGDFDNGGGYLCMDLENDNQIVWLPHEECIGFTAREEFEEEQMLIFPEFSSLISCFFGGETYEIEDEEDDF